MHKEELIAALLDGYKQELEALSEQELHQHFQLQKQITQLTNDEWVGIHKTCKSTAKTGKKG